MTLNFIVEIRFDIFPALAQTRQFKRPQIDTRVQVFAKLTLRNQLATEAQRYLASKAAVGEYLAEQLILPLALAGEGAFTVAKTSAHLLTNIAVVEKFLPVRFTCEPNNGDYLIQVKR